MKRGILITLLSALAGGLTAYAVVKMVLPEQGTEIVQTTMDGARFRTVSLTQDNWPDFTSVMPDINATIDEPTEPREPTR